MHIENCNTLIILKTWYWLWYYVEIRSFESPILILPNCDLNCKDPIPLTLFICFFILLQKLEKKMFCFQKSCPNYWQFFPGFINAFSRPFFNRNETSATIEGGRNGWAINYPQTKHKETKKLSSRQILTKC